MDKKRMSPSEEIRLIRAKLGHLTFERKVKVWLHLGSRRVNAVLGSEQLGIPYGKIMELFGPESQGKTLLGLFILAMAQNDGANAAVVDLENSYDDIWAANQGVDITQLALFQAQIGKFGKEKVLRLQTAQELFEEVECWMARKHHQNPNGKQALLVDSVAAILTEEEAEAGLTEQTMRTNLSQSMFLNKLLRRWVALSQNYNALIIFINQTRMSPNVRYGNPETTPGGKALKFYCSIRARVKRDGPSAGRLFQGKRIVGLTGILKNIKNKAGGGSIESAECGFQTRFDRMEWKFLQAKDVKKRGEKTE